MSRRIFLLITILTIFSFAAHAQSRPRKSGARPAAPKPIPTGAIKTASGLTYLITQKGTGERAKAGDTVTVHYTGTLTNGTKFDSSRDSGQPITFPLGVRRVIKGWDEGIAKLRVGDQAIFIIPPTLGYGASGAGGVIPPNATLIFVVELVAVTDGRERPRQ